LPSMSVNRNVTVPVGRRRSARANSKRSEGSVRTGMAWLPLMYNPHRYCRTGGAPGAREESPVVGGLNGGRRHAGQVAREEGERAPPGVGRGGRPVRGAGVVEERMARAGIDLN